MSFRWFSAPYSFVGCAFSTNNSYVQMRQKLEAYSRLPNGWHFGSGVALKQPIKNIAQNIGSYGATYGLETDVFPAVDGTCSVAFYHGNRKVEVTVNSPSSFAIHSEHGYGFDYTETEPVQVNNLKDVRDTLLNLSGRVWYSSDSFTQSITMLGSAVSAAPPAQYPVKPTKVAQTEPVESLL